MKPLVSVIIRSFNQERIIEHALNSVVSQNYSHLQIVIVDDHSTDGTPKIIREFANKYPEIIEAHFNNRNYGELKTFNIALGLCKGEYISFLDGDDVFFPGKIAAQVEYLNKHSRCTASYHEVAVFYDDPEKPIYKWSDKFGYKVGTSKEVARYGHFPCLVSVMMRRINMPNEGNNPDVVSQGDWLYLIETLENSGGRIDYIDIIFAGYRVHENNISSNWPLKLNSRYKTIKIAEEKYPHLKFALKKYKIDLLFINGIYLISRKEFIKGIGCFYKSFILAFPNIFSPLRLPIREIRFYFMNRGNVDPYQDNFIN